MTQHSPQAVHLKDYTPPDHLVETVDLHIELDPERTRVRSELRIHARPEAASAGRPLRLNGERLVLKSVRLDGRLLAPTDYAVDEESLTLHHPPAHFRLEIETEINPRANTALEGLYLSNGMYCTQCEAEGFRKITYYPDRPDVMARFATTLTAAREACPVLLSNGNPVARGVLDDGRHWVRWEDPFPKPSYLFALVAGDLACVEERFITRSGREIPLRIYVEPHNRDKCAHAMASLQRAMRWDEERFGREYDLDLFMLVAVEDFNMGAMENKGLNVFNAKYVLAKPETATDADYEGIEGVIAHEYFHNWTGNRITCRDWFQLSLKEGLTVFRDQEFSADMGSRAVRRIHDVRNLRAAQFPEDAGPMAHPVRPQSYIEINNFYTATVYEKGAELVRMQHTLLGADGFRRGMDLYFERHDGQAVTTDDFVRAMEDAAGVDLGQFRRWYEQAGTPVLEIEGDYDAAERAYTLRVSQHCPPTPGQPDKLPFHIPLAVGLLDGNGCDLPLRLAGEAVPAPDGTRVLSLRQAHEQFRFVDVPEAPTPSLLRGFSAPVKLRFPYRRQDLAFLMAHDKDAFNRWEAGQQFMLQTLLRLVEDVRQGNALTLDEDLVQAMERILVDADLDAGFRAEMLTLPAVEYVGEQMDVIRVDAIHCARLFVRRELATRLREPFLAAYEEHHGAGVYRYDAKLAGRRRLKNLCLAYLADAEEALGLALCARQFEHADNMTDAVAALGSLAQLDRPERTRALAAFHDKWRHDPLVLDKWFAVQATSRLPGTLDAVNKLLDHPAFDIRNPNKVRALIGAFSRGNPLRFHDASGAGYRFLAEQVLRLDPINPQIAARLLGAMSRWRRYDEKRQDLMRGELERIIASAGLSRDVYEIAAKSLK